MFFKVLRGLGKLDGSQILAVHNEHVQRQIIFSELYYPYWAEIIVLHAQWLAYRKEKRLPIPFEGTNLATSFPKEYQDVLNNWKELSLSGIE